MSLAHVTLYHVISSPWPPTEFFFGVRYCFQSNYKYGSPGQNCTPRPAWLYNCFDDSSTSRAAIAPASILLAFCGRGNRLIPIHLRDLKHATSRSDWYTTPPPNRFIIDPESSTPRHSHRHRWRIIIAPDLLNVIIYFPLLQKNM